MAAEVGAKGKVFVEEHFSTANFKASVEAFLDDGLSELCSDIDSRKSGIHRPKKRNSQAGKTEFISPKNRNWQFIFAVDL